MAGKRLILAKVQEPVPSHYTEPSEEVTVLWELNKHPHFPTVPTERKFETMPSKRLCAPGERQNKSQADPQVEGDPLGSKIQTWDNLKSKKQTIYNLVDPANKDGQCGVGGVPSDSSEKGSPV